MGKSNKAFQFRIYPTAEQKELFDFFERPETGLPKFKSKHHSRDAYTTNLVNGNIRRVHFYHL
ncbi:MAG: helix-turn-helix domain-containing protein [Eubacterium sp.]|nr:helix-turn-helix domain-containing protein [Eubacterium sp.]